MKKILKITFAVLTILVLSLNLVFTSEDQGASNNTTLNLVGKIAHATPEYDQSFCATLSNCIPKSGYTCKWCGTFWCFTMQPAANSGPMGMCNIYPN